MAAERGIHPARGEEDVAGALDLDQQVQRGTDMFFGVGRAQRMMKIVQSLEDPGLAPAVLHVLQAFKPGIPRFDMLR